MSNKTEQWVIAGKPDDAQPEIGKTYKIRDSRKGIFFGRVLTIHHPFATVEVLKGKIKWLSMENNLFNPNPETVSIRCSLCYLIEQEEETS
jgi:hypothetical protein